MVQTIPAKNVTLRSLIDTFKIQLVEDRAFFAEWQGNLPQVSELEKQQLDRIHRNSPQYAVSKLFGIREPEDLTTVFAILKRFGQLVE